MVEKERVQLAMVAEDEWLQPVEEAVNERYDIYCAHLADIERNGSIVDYANGYRYFGWQYDEDMSGWWFREWLPAAHDVYIFGDFNNWQRTQLRLSKDIHGVWSIFLPDAMYECRLTHGSLYKLHIHGDNGWHDRIPAYATRLVQDDASKNYSAQFWIPQPFDWGEDKLVVDKNNLLIYETHIGMSSAKEGVSTYKEFEKKVLPRVKKAGYNAIQVMAIAEHPYYGSFGYHVANFFAPSSRFGTPEELKSLVRKAHKLGIAVIMDIVHAHYVKNFNEGINELDGSPNHYSKEGDAGYQQYWDSKIFDYGKREVEHFLLSNVKYWLDEYHFDGYRFDGVTSMIYHHHGYTDFDCREKFFDEGVNRDALVYLSLANKLVHDFRPEAVTIAEDVSGMPGMCRTIEDGGIGFDFRLGMAIPDFWIRLLEDESDESWNIDEMWDVMTNRLPKVKTVAYAESHDQAMVGDKTIAFRLMDKEMYFAMNKGSENLEVERGMALHKMIRLMTISTGGDAYLCFMGNEFGHPEWIDFPREGNDWSYAHARRQWSLADNGFLRYGQLGLFDKEMLKVVKKYKVLSDGYPYKWHTDHENQTLAFSHKGLYFVFNWSPNNSVPDYRVEVPWAGKYTVELSTDESRFGGFDRQVKGQEHFSETIKDEWGNPHHFIQIYNTARTALVLKWHK